MSLACSSVMRTYPTDYEAKQLILDIGRRMYERHYVSSNDGNISVKSGENRIWITPTSVSKGFMTEDMLICIDQNGHILEGTAKPSSETGMHLRAYQENPEIGAVVHAHPVIATSFAIARIPLNLALMTESVIGLGVVPVAPYATSGTPQVAESIAPYCLDYNAVLLANHGALTWGATALQAYYRMESLECYANIMMNLGYLNKPAHVLTRAQTEELIAARKNFNITGGAMPLCAEDLAKD